MVSSQQYQPRYEILDGLRGVAAVFVIWFHFFEAFATSPVNQMINHGYLAVDFFFVLSGFVIGHAYDHRFKIGKITTSQFMLRRVIRLQPMVVISIVFGFAAYLIQGCVKWDGTPVAASSLILALILGLLLIPIHSVAESDVRGNGEMFPLNGSSWSLFFEYIGSILYATVLHRLNNRALASVVVLSGTGLAVCALGNISGTFSIGVGWSMADWGWAGGFFRLSFSFGTGLMMARMFHRHTVRGAFWICSILIITIMSCPYVGGTEPSIANALYDLVCTVILFPLIVYIGACGVTNDRFTTGICNFAGKLSYPVYIVHYPIMYLFYAWVWNNGLEFNQIWWICALLFVGIIMLAWCTLVFYDEPVRHYLSEKLQHRNVSNASNGHIPGLSKQTSACCGLAHFAVKTGSRKHVDELTLRLEKDGYIVSGQPRLTGDGYYESVILDPEGNLVEITE